MNQFVKTSLALLAVGLTIGHIWYANRTATPQKADWGDVRTAAIQGETDLGVTLAQKRGS